MSRRTRPNNAAYLRQLRAAAIAAGLCMQCRCRPQKAGRKTCEHCLSKARERDAAYKAVGLCECGREPVERHARCQRCIDRADAQSQRYRDKHIALGLCVKCPQPAQPDRMMCAKHLQWNVKKTSGIANAYRAVGLCRCGKEPKHGRVHCQRCLDRLRVHHDRYVEKNRAAGRCVRCPIPVEPGRAQCAKHLKASAAKARGEHVADSSM